jgi:hypothetical protein
MNQSTQVLTLKLPTFWLHLFLGFSSFFVYPFITLSIVASAGTPITVDPYNDSSFEPLSIETSPIKTNSSSNNNNNNNNKALPAGNQNSTMGEILINGNPTPPPPTVVSGSLIKSNETLPQIPSLSEPYRKPDVNNEINQNSPDSEGEIRGKTTTLSASVSPFDQTPDENQPNLTSTNNRPSNLNNTPRTINLSPNSSPTVNKTSNNTENINTPSPQPITTKTNLGRRRSLNDILVFSAPPENNSNNPTITTTTPVNSAVSLTTNANNIHKVLVKVNNSAQESQVKSLYPEAFQTNLRGERMLQVGVFSNPETAQEVSNSLKNMGLKVQITMNN